MDVTRQVDYNSVRNFGRNIKMKISIYVFDVP